MALLDPSTYSALFDDFKRSAFRLETLSQYTIPDDRGRFEAFTRGQPLPPERGDRPWLDKVRQSIATGKSWTRVHTITGPLTPYLRFEIEWGYAYNDLAGEAIHLWQDPDPARHFIDCPYEDFWLFDDENVARMIYGDDGRFVGAVQVQDDITPYLRARDLAMDRAVTLRQFLARQRMVG